MSKTNGCLVTFTEMALACGCPDCAGFIQMIILFERVFLDSQAVAHLRGHLAGMLTLDLEPAGLEKV